MDKKYYTVAIKSRDLKPLTYHSYEELEPFSEVIVFLGKKNVNGYIVKKTEKPSFKTLQIIQATGNFLLQYQKELAIFISYYYTCEIGISTNLFIPSHNTDTINNDTIIKLPNLNQMQKDALDFINKNQISLIFGDTGSGKSEIYISSIANTLNKNKSALLLMPEISLTPQMQIRLERYFGENVAIWHSKITPKKKEKILKDIQSKKIRLIAGARSALFLPIKDLELIVIDEEHDDSYKSQNQKPYYNARDLAIFIGNKLNIKVILGSATPSLTSFYKIPNFRLKGTFFKSKKDFIYDNSEVGISQIIKENIAQCLKEKKQAIICLPTRANFKYLTCKNCSNTIKCPFCSVGMSYYKREKLLKCQYCEYKMPIPNECDICKSQMIEAKKIGTSELLEIIQNEFKNAKISKFDRDEITTQKKLENILKEFNNGNIDILIGTQMISKGHDYHNVNLAIIMGIDDLLNYPDFKAREKTLALAMQVAGRAGRAGSGRIIIQSKQKDFFEKYIQDFDTFLNDEVNFRKNLYPPFTRLLRLVISHKDQNKANEVLNQCLYQINGLLQKEHSFEIIGYGKCAIEYIGSKFRFDILIRSQSHIPLLKISKICNFNHVDIDIDPINFS